MLARILWILYLSFLQQKLMAYIAVLFLSVYVASVHGTAVITSTSPPSICNETSGGGTVYLTPGDTVTVDCTANNSGISDSIQNTLAWTTPDGTGLSLLTISQSTTSGRYSFSVTSFDDTLSTAFISSNITFIVNQMDDERSIRCTTTANGLSRVTCTLLVYTTPNVTTNLNAISVTYNSTTLSWTPPTDTGGYPTVNYIIEVTGSNNETIITTDNSIIYTNVECHQTYTFTVRANNSIGEGDPSNTVNVTIKCYAPTLQPLTSICLNCANDSLDWTPCQLMISPNETTPPVTQYNVSVGGMVVASVADDCTIDDMSLTGLTGSNTFTFKAINIAGSSNVSASFNVDLLQNVREIFVNISHAEVKFKTIECLKSCDDYTVELIYNNITSSPLTYEANTTSSFSLSSLQPGTTVSYTLQVIDIVESVTRTSTVGTYNVPTVTPTPSPDPTEPTNSTNSTEPTGSTEPTEPVDTTTAAIIGGAVGGVVVIIVLIILVIFLIAGCIWYQKRRKTIKVDLNTNGRGESSEPIPLVEKSIPETGQPTYQDPNTIERQAAPTGDLYAMPDKPKGRREPPVQPELATYQDPNTIQRQQAPTGDLYALPAQKPVYSEVNKENKTQGVTYAPLMFDQQQPSSESTRSPPADVVYSDVQRL